MNQPPAKRVKTGPIITRYPPPPGYRGPAQPTQPQYPIYQPAQQPAWPGYPSQQYVSNGYSAYAPTWQQPLMPAGMPPQAATSYPWQAQNAQYNPNKRRHSSIPSAHSRQASIAVPLDGNGDPLPAQTAVENDDLEHEFDAECYYARHPDEIDPSLSLGLIEWHAPKPSRHPLAGSFAEAEVEVIAPRVPRSVDEPSISDYFTKDKLEESLRSVRQQAAWDEIKDDLIYRQFSRVCKEVVRMSELISRYQDRPDPSWEAEEDGGELHDSIMEDDSNGCVKSTEQAEEADILGNLEQALTADNVNRLPNSKRAAGGSKTHSRATSVASTAGERITRPKLLEPIRDAAQEDVLATLGVTGSPKVVYQTPGPALGPGSQADRSSRHGSVASDNGHTRQASRGSSYRDHDTDATPRANRYYERSGDSSRKRSYGDYYEERRYGYDDRTPRPHYKQRRVDRAYE